MLVNLQITTVVSKSLQSAVHILAAGQLFQIMEITCNRSMLDDTPSVAKASSLTKSLV
jgi:hypothetical protein